MIIGQHEVLPMHRGYAMGSIIKKEDLILPLWDKRRRVVEDLMHTILVAKEEMIKSHQYVAADDAIQKVRIAAMDREIINLKAEYKKIAEELSKIYQLDYQFSVEEALPIDSTDSKIQILNRGFESERLLHLTVRKNENPSNLTSLEHKVEAFVARLFSQDAYPSLLPVGSLEGLVSSMESTLETENELTLIGSFVTLARTRVMNPVVFRRKAKVSDELKKNAQKYVVLTEAVLGAVFLGVGKGIPGADLNEKIEDSKHTLSLMSRLSTLSFVSQGAIPRPSNKDTDDLHLLGVYSQWKEVLATDENSGYSIGYRWRELDDVFLENAVFP